MLGVDVDLLEVGSSGKAFDQREADRGTAGPARDPELAATPGRVELLDGGRVAEDGVGDAKAREARRRRELDPGQGGEVIRACRLDAVGSEVAPGHAVTSPRSRPRP